MPSRVTATSTLRGAAHAKDATTTPKKKKKTQTPSRETSRAKPSRAALAVDAALDAAMPPPANAANAIASVPSKRKRASATKPKRERENVAKEATKISRRDASGARASTPSNATHAPLIGAMTASGGGANASAGGGANANAGGKGAGRKKEGAGASGRAGGWAGASGRRSSANAGAGEGDGGDDDDWEEYYDDEDGGGGGDRDDDTESDDDGEDKDDDGDVDDEDDTDEDAMDDDDDSDDDDDDDDDDHHHHSRRHRRRMGEAFDDAMDSGDPEAGLRALLRRLGSAAAGGGGMFRQGHSSRSQELLRGLQAMDDPSAQMAALSELNEMLVISGEEVMMSMPLAPFVQALVELMQLEYMPDIMLLAARALTTMADVMPPSRGVIVHHGAVAQFCSRLLTIEYIDLAEQSLQALEKLSQDYGAECARQGALIACLSYLDFFSIGMQRVGLQTAANICRQFPSSALTDGTADAIPILINILLHDDPRLVDCACVCLTSLAAKMSKDPSKLAAFCSGNLVANVMQLISPNTSRAVSPSTHHSLIKLLNVCARNNPDVAIELLRRDLPETLNIALSGCKVLTTVNSGPMSASPASGGAAASPIVTSEHLLEVATLTDALLPAVSPKTRSSSRSPKTNNDKNEPATCAVNIPILTKEEPDLLVKFAKNLTSVLMQAVDSSVPQGVKVKCLSALTKWTHLASQESFKDVLETSPLAAFCASQLTSKDPQRMQGSLDLIELGMEKSSEAFAKVLRKEGAVHALQRLSEEQQRTSSAMDASAAPAASARDSTKTPSDRLVPALGGGLRGQALRAAASTESPEYHNAVARAHTLYAKLFIQRGGKADDLSVERLRDASATLRASSDIEAIVAFLEAVTGASTFELLECDAVGALKDFLIPKDWNDTQKLVHNYAAFIKAAGQTKESDAFNTLVKRLSDALSSCEDLSIAITSISSMSRRGGRGSSGAGEDSSLAGLVRPFKIRFKLCSDANDLSDYSSNVILVEPFATLSAIEDFLYPRVQKRTSRGAADSTPRRSSRLQTPPPEDDGESDGESDSRDRTASDEDGDEYMSDEYDEDEPVLGDEADEPMEARDLDLTNGNEGNDVAAAAAAAPTPPPAPAGSFAQAAAAANMSNRLVFAANGVELHSSTSILQAIAMSASVDKTTLTQSNWENVNTLTYRAAKPTDVVPAPLKLGGIIEDSSADASDIAESIAELGNSEVRSTLMSFIPALKDKVKNAVSNEETSTQFNNLLALLTVLHELSISAPRVLLLDRSGPLTDARNVALPEESFIHGKLTGKLTRQLQDTITLCSASTPSWCTSLARTCPWLFPFELRQKLFKCVSFSLSRMLHHLHGDGSDGALTTDGGREIRIGRLQRQKVRVNRDQIFESAKKVFAIPNTSKMVLEVEFFQEVGTGTGPTLEFFTLLSKQFKRRKLHLWRDEGGSNADDHVVAPHGLFPAPSTKMQHGTKEHVNRVKNFKILGQAIAKVLQDGRMLDLALAPAFYRGMMGKTLGLYDLVELDPGLGKTLLRLDAAAAKIEHMKREGRPESEWRNVTVDGANIEDLSLMFVLPGHSSSELTKCGSDVPVTAVNLREYVDAVVDACVGSGVSLYFESLRSGVEEILPLARLKMFNEAELEALICGQGENWTPQMLVDCIKFDHGYSAQSLPIQNFCDILSSFSSDQQRAFMRFVTGAPRLPPGGLAALQPRLTVVCKQPSCAVGLSSDAAILSAGTPLADGDLPSAMTCASYLKLPPYSCKEVMSERLQYAMNEGSGSFDLS
jgi:E3 ubiquitin-protein ligase TRIP12